MQFDVITIFPNFFDSFLRESIIQRAQKEGLIRVNIHNLRDFTTNSHKTVDDKPFGGGIGMVLKIEPIYRAVEKIKEKGKNIKKQKVILLTPRGEKFNQKMATEFSKLDRLIIICGRYEGIDERVAKYIADKNISIGNFVLMGGAVAAMAIIEAVARLIPGVLGKPQLLKERVTKEKGFVEYPQYTRPEIFSPKKGVEWKVPKILLSGHHKKIAQWRKKHTKIIK